MADRHRRNRDLWALLDAARSLSQGNPESSAPGEVFQKASVQVDRMKAILRDAEAKAAKQRTPEASRELLDAKEALADSSELLRQAEDLAHPVPDNEANERP